MSTQLHEVSSRDATSLIRCENQSVSLTFKERFCGECEDVNVPVDGLGPRSTHNQSKDAIVSPHNTSSFDLRKKIVNKTCLEWLVNTESAVFELVSRSIPHRERNPGDCPDVPKTLQQS